MAEEDTGALGKLAGSGTDGVLGALQQLMQNPINPDRQDMAYRAGMLGNDGGGGIGAALGNALGAADKVASQQEALRASYIPHVTAAMIQAQQFALQRQLIDRAMSVMQAEEAARNGGAQSTPTQQSSVIPSGTPYAGQLGSGTTGIFAPPAQVGSPSSTQQGAQGQRIGLLRPGQTAGAAMLQMGMDPKSFWDGINKTLEPTTDMKNWAFAGTTPQEVHAGQMGKFAKESEIDRKAGNQFVNPFLNQAGMVPSIATGQNINGAPAANGSIASTTPIPNNLAQVRANSKASEDGTTDARVINVTGPDGRIVPVRAGAAADVGAAQLGLPGAPVDPGYVAPTTPFTPKQLADAKIAANNGNAQAQQFLEAYNKAHPAQPTPAGTAPPAGQQLGQSTGAVLLTKQGADILEKSNQEQSASGLMRSYLLEQQKLIQSGAKFGPMQANIAEWKAKVPFIDWTGAQTNQDVMGKLAANLASANPSRSDAELLNYQKGNPSGVMTNEAGLKVIPMLLNRLDLIDARNKAVNNASNAGLEKVPGAYSGFNQMADPSVIAIGKQMAQASQNGPKAVEAFVAQLKAHRPGDWQNVLKQAHALDMMGAF